MLQIEIKPAFSIYLNSSESTWRTVFGFIPDSDRIVVIEDTLELNTFLEDSCSRLESDDDLSLADLVKNSLRMRPERIIIGEVRGEEALDLVQISNNTILDSPPYGGVIGGISYHSNLIFAAYTEANATFNFFETKLINPSEMLIVI